MKRALKVSVTGLVIVYGLPISMAVRGAVALGELAKRRGGEPR